MKSGEPLGTQAIDKLVGDPSAVESAVLAHLSVHGLTTVDVWDMAADLKVHGRPAVGAAIRRLTRRRLLQRGTLHHGRFYFYLTSQSERVLDDGKRRSGIYSEPVKLALHARSMLMSKFRPELQPVDMNRFGKLFGADFPGQARAFLVNNAKLNSLTFMRIDNRIQSRPARAAQVIRTDILRFAKHARLAELMKSQQFEYIWITTTPPRVKAVQERFRQYARVGKSPITVIVMPELLPLLVGIPIHKEIVAPRTIT